MIVCGIKMTHDGSVALIENGELIFSVEIEKRKNNFRYSSIDDTLMIEEILKEHGYAAEDVDYFAIDGWEGLEPESYNFTSAGQKFEMKLAPYREVTLNQSILEAYSYPQGLTIGDRKFDYQSYMHVTGHVMSGYSTSPFAQQNEGSYVLVWDGGMFPRFYYVDPEKKEINNFGKLFLLIGNIYAQFALHFEPFKKEYNAINARLSVAGKVMAYIANGARQQPLVDVMERIYKEKLELSLDFGEIFARNFIKETRKMGYSSGDILASFHAFLEEMILLELGKKMEKYPRKNNNLCFMGGCALNIKWNSAIRRSGMFNDVWVPPFPNDSGSAIGVAASEWLHRTGKMAINWSVYSGPALEQNTELVQGWASKKCTVVELAELIYKSQEPVVVLNGKAELGPRALGNRSIIGSTLTSKMKEKLNHIKNREAYRPIAPLCIEERAPVFFDPGCQDPYMLFDHQIRPEWSTKLSAISHIDNSARLQTVTKESNPMIYELLLEYEKWSTIPVLTNTSANFKGKGFFPDVRTAMEWGGTSYIWSENQLYYKK